MRVISGTLKGRNIEGYNIEGTRPTMDRVKESVFAIIQNELNNSVFLDLFSGSGSIGIEAISNGSKLCYFVDNNSKAINTIKTNIDKFNIKDKSIILEKDYNKALNYFIDNKISFDLIYIDPPYKTNYINSILDIIYKNRLLNKDGTIILEYTNLNKDINFNIVKIKRYSDKYIAILKNKN